jgi:hypothetical protein
MDGTMTTMNNMGLPPDLKQTVLVYITTHHATLNQQEQFEEFE